MLLQRKYTNGIPNVCCRCNKEKGTMLHIWWHCDRLVPFWSKVKEIIYQIMETKLTLDVACCLINISNFSFRKYKNSLSRHLINAVKSLIPLCWKSTNIPTIKDWLHKISYICKMEETVAQSNENVKRYHKTWSPRFIYKYSQDYEKLIR